MALTITEFRARKGSDEKLALLTACDATVARAVRIVARTTTKLISSSLAFKRVMTRTAGEDVIAVTARKRQTNVSVNGDAVRQRTAA